MRTWSDWTWTPSRAYIAKSGKASRPIVNVPSGDATSSFATPTRGSIALTIRSPIRASPKPSRKAPDPGA